MKTFNNPSQDVPVARDIVDNWSNNLSPVHNTGIICRLSKLTHQNGLIIPKDWHTYATPRLLEKLGLCTQSGGGFMYLSPIQQQMMNRLEALVKMELNEASFCESALPTIVPTRLLDLSQKRTTFKRELLELPGRAEGYMLAATSEEIFLEGLKKGGLTSYRQLPVKEMYIQNCYRWIDRYESYYSTREIHAAICSTLDANLDDYCDSLADFSQACTRIFNRLELFTIKIEAQDGTAIEFLFNNSRGDRMINDSIAFRRSNAPADINEVVQNDTKFSSLAMGYRFSHVSPFEISFTNSSGAIQEPIMGTYGIGLQRVIFGIFENNRQAYGINLSPDIRPFDVSLITLPCKDGEVARRAESVAREIRRSGFSVAIDDRVNVILSEKFRFADFYNIPTRVVIGPRDLASEKLELRRIGKKEVEQIDREKLLSKIVV